MITVMTPVNCWEYRFIQTQHFVWKLQLAKQMTAAEYKITFIIANTVNTAETWSKLDARSFVFGLYECILHFNFCK